MALKSSDIRSQYYQYVFVELVILIDISAFAFMLYEVISIRPRECLMCRTYFPDVLWADLYPNMQPS